MIKYLNYYYSKYPKSEIQDFIKLVYQMEFGSTQFIDNIGESLKNIKEEIDQLTESKYENLYDHIGDDYVRVNLRPYNHYKLNINSLNEYLSESANIISEKTKSFDEELSILRSFLLSNNFDREKVGSTFKKYKEDGYPMLEHSNTYNNEYKPSYRIIHKKFLTEEMKFYQVKHFLDQFNNSPIIYLAIDGKCTSGKTTLSNLIHKEFGATIIHIDDFFDTSNEEIGINSNRIIEEVFNQISVGKPLSYRKYDCTSKNYKTITINKVDPIVIFEGVYSANEKLIDRYHGIIYMDIDEKEQINRLTIRSKHLLNKFINEWIPRENKYFETFNIKYKADIIV